MAELYLVGTNTSYGRSWVTSGPIVVVVTATAVVVVEGEVVGTVVGTVTATLLVAGATAEGEVAVDLEDVQPARRTIAMTALVRIFTSPP